MKAVEPELEDFVTVVGIWEEELFDLLRMLDLILEIKSLGLTAASSGLWMVGAGGLNWDWVNGCGPQCGHDWLVLHFQRTGSL